MDHAADSAARLREFIEHRSEKAFAALVRDHLDLVYSVALRRCGGQTGMAQDICQTVFTDFARKAAALPADVVVAGWLYQHASYVAATMLRAEDRRRRREGIAMQLRSLADDTDWPRLAPLLDDALLELDPSDRDPIVLRYLEQRPLAEVGSRLGLSENTARMRVDRALDKLRAKLAKRGVTSTASALAVALAGPAVTAAPATLAATITAAALGAAVTTTSSLGLLSFMASTKLKTAGLALLIAATGTTIAVQELSARRLRAENTDLRQRAGQAAEDSRLAREAATQSAEAAARARQPAEELLRLRGEVGQLRQAARTAVPEKPVPRTAGDKAPPAPPARFRTDLGDVGAATPQMAASSFIWAATAGEHARVSELLELPANVPAADAAKHHDFLAKLMSNSFSGKRFIELQGIDTNPDGTLKLSLGYEDIGNGRTNTFPFLLRLHESVWKVVVEGEAPKDLDATQKQAPPP